MNVMIFDTETTSLKKPFCYNIGYKIARLDTNSVTTLTEKDFVVEQIWHNMELFSTAYYTNKRPIYVNRMRARKTKMDKFGYICQEMIRDIKAFNVAGAYAYNCEFDEKVFNFNCEWHKCSNPLDLIPVYDIRGYVHHSFAFSTEYKAFCEANNKFTESGNYSTTAETAYQFIRNDTSFIEEHTALSDSIIECDILAVCVYTYHAKLDYPYQAYKTVPRNKEKTLEVFVNREKQAEYPYTSKVTRKKGDKIYLTNDNNLNK